MVLSARVARSQQPESGTIANAPASVFAGRPPYQVVYDHVTGGVEVRTEKGRVVERWARWETESASLIRLPADRPVAVVIENANALLYAYDVSAVVVSRRDVKTCREIGRGFGPTGLVSAISVVSSGIGPAGWAAEVAGKMVPRGERPVFAARQVTRQTTAAALEQTLQEARQPLEGYAVFAAALARVARTLDDSLAKIAELGESTPIAPLLAQLQRDIERLGPDSDLSNPARVVAVLQRHWDAAVTHRDALVSLTRALRGGTPDGGSGLATEARALAERVDSTNADLDTTYHKLQLGLMRVQLALARSKQTFRAGASGDVRRLAIELGAAPGWETVPRVRQGRIEIYTEPTVGIRCELSIGVAWMGGPPDYAVQDTVLVDRASATRAAANLALHVSAPGFPLGGLLGVGIGASERPDFYLGASLRVLSPILLNGGVVWQYMTRLPAGLQVGQRLSSPSALQGLGLAYRPHAFWGLSYAP